MAYAMSESPDKHSQSAEALKAMAEGGPKPGVGSADGFVGPEQPEDDPTRVEGGAGEEPVLAATALGEERPPGGGGAGTPAESVAGAVGELGSRRQHAADFNQRERLAHAHQYKTIMIPLLLTMGVLLLLMGLFVILRGSGAENADPALDQSFSITFQQYFPLLALPLGAILLVGAWWFHRDVKRKRT
jgi:hypothetical protein